MFLIDLLYVSKEEFRFHKENTFCKFDFLRLESFDAALQKMNVKLYFAQRYRFISVSLKRRIIRIEFQQGERQLESPFQRIARSYLARIGRIEHRHAFFFRIRRKTAYK